MRQGSLGASNQSRRYILLTEKTEGLEKINK